MRSLAQFDPDIKRPYSQALNFGITHELLTGLSVAAEYYRIDFKNITMRLNSLLNADSYNRFEVANPLGGDNVPVWVIKPEFRGRVANIDSTSDDMKRNYNGVDINFNARIRGGVRAFGGFNLERSINDVCVSAAERSEPFALLRPERQRHSVAEAVQGHGGLPAALLGHFGQRRAAEPERLPRGHRGAGLRRLHRRHRLRQSARSGHVPADHADHGRPPRPTSARR